MCRGLCLATTDPPHSCEVEAMVELMTVRLAELVNARMRRSDGNPQARLGLEIYAVPVCKKGAAKCVGPSEGGNAPPGTTVRSQLSK
jgi:hypothetical protein